MVTLGEIGEQLIPDAEMPTLPSEDGVRRNATRVDVLTKAEREAWWL